MACTIATSCCISGVPSQWEGQNFDPPQLPHFSTDLNETWNQERYPGYDPTGKIWLMWDDGKGVCIVRAFSVTFCTFLLFVDIVGHSRWIQEARDTESDCALWSSYKWCWLVYSCSSNTRLYWCWSVVTCEICYDSGSWKMGQLCWQGALSYCAVAECCFLGCKLVHLE